jgi:NAD(P)-dependent dehydrogenase (short-subunit alcohol dehydrogenase family)
VSNDKRGRIAVVTGAASGIGAACAIRLARDGAAVALLDVADAAETGRSIADAGGTAVAIRCDVTDPESVAAAAARVLAELGTATIVANIAGTGYESPVWDLPLEEWRRVFAVNVDGPFLVCKAFAPGMREAGWGRIVNVTSPMVATTVPNTAPYFASKMALTGLTRALANDLGDANITVNALGPGLTRTPLTAPLRDSGVFELALAGQVIKRVGEVDDQAAAMSFLTSDDASFITGQTLLVEGGMVRL